MRSVLFAALFGIMATTAWAQETITREEFRLRRQNAMAQLRDGILLLHARSLLANEDQLFVHGFQQNPNFYYFSGLPSVVGAILAIDGIAQESWLFVPSKLSGLAAQMPNTRLAPGASSQNELLIEHVVAWEEFIPFIERRQKEKPDLILYTTESYWSPTPESNPPGLAPIDDANVLWRQTLQARWPAQRFASAKKIITDLRLIKSAGEIAAIKRVAEISAVALRKGLRGVRANRSQREVEAEIVCECILAGGEGPSFWPWVMSGPNAVFPKPFASLADYHHLNRVMQAGELVRVDIGCDYDFYKGDVGRTAPVSGKFEAAQRETWNLLIRAYRAGLAVMREGATDEMVAQAGRAAAKQAQAQMTTTLGKQAAALLQREDNAEIWHLHGSGLEPGEGPPQIFKAGMVLEFEPMFAIGDQAFYLEDMLLITPTGVEVLTHGLPYTAEEIETAMASHD